MLGNILCVCLSVCMCVCVDMFGHVGMITHAYLTEFVCVCVCVCVKVTH